MLRFLVLQPACARLGLLGATASALALMGCEKNNPAVAADAALDGPPTGCKAEPSKCTGATAVCDTVGDVCVECLPTAAAACLGAEPV